jgi:hypothetical protein
MCIRDRQQPVNRGKERVSGLPVGRQKRWQVLSTALTFCYLEKSFRDFSPLKRIIVSGDWAAMVSRLAPLPGNGTAVEVQDFTVFETRNENENRVKVNLILILDLILILLCVKLLAPIFRPDVHFASSAFSGLATVGKDAEFDAVIINRGILPALKVDVCLMDNDKIVIKKTTYFLKKDEKADIVF